MEAIANDKDNLDIEEGLSEEKPKKRYLKHKLDKKVTVKHFLNKKIIVNKNDTEFYFQESLFQESLIFDKEFFRGPIYPVYVQITFNRKTTTIKSATHENFTEKAFEYHSNNGYIQNLFERERNFIEFHFQDRYKNHLDYLTEQFKISRLNYPTDLFYSVDEDFNMFIEIMKDDYDINRFIKEYSYNSHEIHKYIDSALYEEIIEFKKNIGLQEVKKINTKLKNEFQYDKIELENIKMLPLDGFYKSGIKVRALELLSFLEMRDIRFSELRIRYPSEIWHFAVYYRFLKTSHNNPYLKLSATILDYINGDFETFFLSTFKNDKQKALMILKDLELLIKKKSIQK